MHVPVLVRWQLRQPAQAKDSQIIHKPKTNSDSASAGTPAPNRVQHVDNKESERSSDAGGARKRF